MSAVLLGLVSAFFFGAMTVALRFALGRVHDAEGGTLLTILVAVAVTLPFVAAQSRHWGEIWPFLLAGILGPGLSQLLFTLAVRDAGPSRTSVAVGSAPLFSVAIALLLLGEPAHAGLLAGAVAIVGGGILLVGERDRPEHVRRIGFAFALGAAFVFATRDNLVRHLSIGSDVSPALAAASTLTAGGVVVALFLLGTQRRLPTRGLLAFTPAGICFGLSYIALFEGYYRGRVTVVSPLVATESLWGVGLSALLLGRHELVGKRLVAGAALVVAGGALISVFR